MIPASRRGRASTLRATAAHSHGCPARTIPQTNLYIFGTGNPTPAYTPGRGDETMDNLFTGSLIAVNVDTGKMAWYYQTAPHDMHDWDSAQTPVLVDAMFKGRMRKLVMTAARNGYFFVLDRVTGEHLLTEQVRLGDQLGEAPRRERAVRMRNPEKDPTDRRLDRLAKRRRHDQLGAARVFSGYRFVLRRARTTSIRSSICSTPIPADRWDWAASSKHAPALAAAS